MSLVIGTNVSALYSQNALKTNARTTATTMERLSTGVRVNNAKDDAAGLAIGQNMTSKIRGLDQAVRNINDGINLVQTAEGGLNSISNMLQRMRELAVQAANGTNSDVQRGYLNKECEQLQTAIGQVVDTTMWNDQKLLDGSFAKPIQIGSDVGTKMNITIPNCAELV
jgi:flagellin